MEKFTILFRKDLLELWRTKKILILGLVFLFFALTSPLLTYYLPEFLKLAGAGSSGEAGESLQQLVISKTTLYDSYSQFYNQIGQIGLLVLLILFAGLIVNERRKGQFTSLLNNGVSKAQFVLSKVFSQILIFSLILVFSIGVFSLYNIILFHEAWLSHSFFSLLLTYVYFIFVICLTNFFSSWMKSMILAMVSSLTVTIFINLFGMFEFGKYLPNNLSTLSLNVLSGKDMTLAYQSMGISLLISLVLTVLAVRLCSNRD